MSTRTPKIFSHPNHVDIMFYSILYSYNVLGGFHGYTFITRTYVLKDTLARFEGHRTTGDRSLCEQTFFYLCWDWAMVLKGGGVRPQAEPGRAWHAS